MVIHPFIWVLVTVAILSAALLYSISDGYSERLKRIAEHKENGDIEDESVDQLSHEILHPYVIVHWDEEYKGKVEHKVSATSEIHAKVLFMKETALDHTHIVSIT